MTQKEINEYAEKRTVKIMWILNAILFVGLIFYFMSFV